MMDERPAERDGKPPNRDLDVPPLTLGTAGHIDHGKTALVGLLTGRNTDRLREEQERGISIELGYAELVLPDGVRLSVVDVPGHERFVRTMVAGATGIDLFLLVIAADDGVMPQTREHVAILELLGVREGVVALSKADVVDEELFELAGEDVRDFLSGTMYEQCEVVAVSARDGRGEHELLGALERAAARVHARRRSGPARLPVDRVFPLKGIGTVVTGTVWQGEIRPGDVLLIQPGEVRAAVRSVQVHDHDAEVARAGNRAGVNLRGLDRDDVPRGHWLVAPPLAGHVVRRFDAWIRLLPGARPLRSGDAVRLHHGTTQFIASISPLIGREFAPGTEGPATVRLDAEAAVEPRDRFILRTLSPVATFGGGIVLAIDARRWQHRERHAAFLAALNAEDARHVAVELAGDARHAGVAADDLIALGFEPAEAAAALRAGEAAGELEALDVFDSASGGRSARDQQRWFSHGRLAELTAALLKATGVRATARPERPFSASAELAVVTPALGGAGVEALLRRLVANGELVAGEGGYAPAGAGILSTEQESLAEQVLERLRSQPLMPPTLAALSVELGRPSRELVQILDVLTRRSDSVRVDKDLWFATEAVARAREQVLAMLDANGDVTIASLRDALGCGRRNAQALLELFDREGLTLRRGDVRIARRRR